MSGILSRANTWLDGFVERACLKSDDPHVQTRALLLILFAAISAVSSFVWGVSHLIYGSNLTLVAFLFAAGLLIVLALIRLWQTGSLLVGCRHALLLSFTTTVVATYFTGGLRLTNVCAFSSMLLVPVFLLGRRGVAWSLTAFAFALAFQIATWSGFVFPDLVPEEGRAADAFITWVQAAVMMLLFVVLYDAARARATDRMRDAVRAKSTLLANLSHEIRTPLHVMMGVNRQLAAAPLSPTQQKLIATSQDNAGSLLSLFDDLLDLARMEHGKLALRPVDFDPVQVVREVAQVVRHLCDGKGLVVSARIDSDVPRRVHGDGQRVRQVLLNLGVNAVKFTEHGRITVSLSRAPATPEACHFAVEDTGIGLAHADTARIFDSFTQIDGSPARRHDGAGLGLAISRDLVQRMGGEISVASTLGKGSTFSFFIPFATPVSPAGSDSRPPPAFVRHPGTRVLVIEDLAFNRELARAMLEAVGCAVVAAANGAEGLARWQEQPPDLVLMDIQMPGMDGFEVTRQIRSRELEEKRRSVPIIALTGRASTEDRELCLAAGMNDCLFKPFDASELQALVGQHLETGRRR